MVIAFGVLFVAQQGTDNPVVTATYDDLDDGQCDSNHCSLREAINGHYHADETEAVARLLDMGIEPYLVSSSVVLVIAQRLVRTVCKH